MELHWCIFIGFLVDALFTLAKIAQTMQEKRIYLTLNSCCNIKEFELFMRINNN